MHNKYQVLDIMSKRAISEKLESRIFKSLENGDIEIITFSPILIFNVKPKMGIVYFIRGSMEEIYVSIDETRLI